MALDPSELAKLLKLRAVGWSQQEIADAIGTSQQVVAYHLKKLKEESLKRSRRGVRCSHLRWPCSWCWNCSKYDDVDFDVEEVNNVSITDLLRTANSDSKALQWRAGNFPLANELMK